MAILVARTNLPVWDFQKLASLVGVLNSFIEEFRLLLEANDVEIDELHREWASFKTLWLRNLIHMSRDGLWETIILHYEDTYPGMRLNN